MRERSTCNYQGNCYLENLGNDLVTQKCKCFAGFKSEATRCASVAGEVRPPALLAHCAATGELNRPWPAQIVGGTLQVLPPGTPLSSGSAVVRNKMLASAEVARKSGPWKYVHGFASRAIDSRSRRSPAASS
jgi:hypothetical protein